MKFRIGCYELENRVVSAPMAGISDQAYRLMAASFGCGLVFTEMISDQALNYNHPKTRRMLDVSLDQVPVVVQLFGSNPVYMARAAVAARDAGALLLDINMGCPTPKIVRNGEGAALMKDLALARQVIRSVVCAVDCPVTVKMRKGWDDHSINYLDLGKIAEDEGAAAVTLHPRTREQFFSGKADWEAIRLAKAELEIPVIGNGDIFNPGDALSMMEFTGCDAVMVGRGALGNPFLFAGIAAVLRGDPEPQPPSRTERIDTALRHFALMESCKGLAQTSVEMRKHLAWYIKGMPGSAQARNLINQATSRQEIIAVLNQIR